MATPTPSQGTPPKQDQPPLPVPARITEPQTSAYPTTQSPFGRPNLIDSPSFLELLDVDPVSPVPASLLDSLDVDRESPSIDHVPSEPTELSNTFVRLLASHPRSPLVLNNMASRLPTPPYVDVSTLDMNHVQLASLPTPPHVDLSTLDMNEVILASVSGLRIDEEVVRAINGIFNGPAIIDYWNENHPLWAELKCVFNEDPENRHLIPPNIGAKLTRAIEQITRECTDANVNPSTRVNGIWALLHIIKWVCMIIGWPLEFHKLDLNKTFWWRDDPLSEHTTASPDQAMAQIIRMMHPVERELIWREICQRPIISEMEYVTADVGRIQNYYRDIHIFENIKLPLRLIKDGCMIRNSFSRTAVGLEAPFWERSSG